jgi:multiple sugar transport system substrate-binding protein
MEGDHPMRRAKLRAAIVCAIVIAATATVMISSAGTAAQAQSGSTRALSGEITVFYSYNYVFNSVDLAKKWWGNIAKEWKTKYPNVKLNLVGVGGTDIDEMNKAALLFRSKSQAPDVLQLPTTFVSQFGGSGFLADLSKYVGSKSTAPFWSNFPKPVQDMGRFNSTLYAINCGNNDSAVVFNKKILTKAGVKMPWKPKSWNDILAAARLVKKSSPGVYPLWLAAGVAAGPTNVLQGSGNLIYGTKQPVMFDAASKKWVVDSTSLRGVLGFYKSVFSEKLGAPTSELFRPDSVGRPPLLFKQGKLAIAIGSNWYPTVWVSPDSAAPWKEGLKTAGIAPMPTQNGQAPGATSTLGGWAFAMGAHSKNPDAAWAFIQMASEPKNMLTEALWSGFVPPDQTVGKLPEFVNYAPPFQLAFNLVAQYGKPLPTDQNFPVYARALNTATGQLAQHPDTSIDDAIKLIDSNVKQQLGGSATEKLK